MRRMYSESELRKLIQEQVSSGQLEDVKVFENIVDSQGHKRFIEGEVELQPTASNTFTKVYGKWSLSGTHLMIVLMLNIAAEKTWVYDILTYLDNIPDWVKDKIYVNFGNTVQLVDGNAYGANSSDTKTFRAFLIKSSDRLNITLSNFTPGEASKTMRIAFDLLIDNESEE